MVMIMEEDIEDMELAQEFFFMNEDRNNEDRIIENLELPDEDVGTERER